jgi:hypothetical protein
VSKIGCKENKINFEQSWFQVEDDLGLLAQPSLHLFMVLYADWVEYSETQQN